MKPIDLRKRFDLLIGGIQIQSRKKRGIGTLACIVFGKDTGKPLGLTNRHILKKNRGFSVIQPAYKSRTKEYIIGNILRKGGKGRDNDFAVFEINTDNRKYDTNNSIAILEGKITEFVTASAGMKVQKVGQFTGRTFGIVEKVVNNTVYIKPNPKKPCKEISQGGDSGALWVTDEDDFKAVALHRAGEPDKEGSTQPDIAYAIPIERVMKRLNVRF